MLAYIPYMDPMGMIHNIQLSQNFGKQKILSRTRKKDFPES